MNRAFKRSKQCGQMVRGCWASPAGCIQRAAWEQPATAAAMLSVLDADHTGQGGSGCHFHSQHSVLMQLRHSLELPFSSLLSSCMHIHYIHISSALLNAHCNPFEANYCGKYHILRFTNTTSDCTPVAWQVDFIKVCPLGKYSSMYMNVNTGGCWHEAVSDTNAASASTQHSLRGLLHPSPSTPLSPVMLDNNVKAR